jgi:putative flippase GtrA
MTNLPTVLRFGAVGGSAFLIDSGLLMLLAHLGLGLYLGRLISLAASIVFSFFMNRAFAFRVSHALTWSEFAQYIRAVLIGSALSYVLYSAGIFMGFHPLLSLAVATLVTAAFNFLQFKRLFSTPPEGLRQESLKDQQTPQDKG